MTQAQTPHFPMGMHGALLFGFVCWGVFAFPIILEGAVFINLHPLVVVGRLLDWLSTSLLATAVTALWFR